MSAQAMSFEDRWGEWPVDPLLLSAVLTLIGIGVVMVFSATIVLINGGDGVNLSHIQKHIVFLAIGLSAMFVVSRIPVDHWMTVDRLLLIIGFLLLAAVLVPGIGSKVNHATRWINLGLFTFQPSEIIKVIFVMYFAAYLARQGDYIRHADKGIVVPGILLAVVGFLLICEPDFGTFAVLLATVGTMLFLSGLRLTHLSLCVVAAAIAVFALTMVGGTYRAGRLVSFWEPFASEAPANYQLRNALMALGRGEWFGSGLGSSLQKLQFLPEAHNDFLVAIIAEELGYVGLLLVTLMFAVILWRAFAIARKAVAARNIFAARLAQGLGMLIVIQALINLGVNTGSLPTKGLTMPFVGTGGSGLIMNCVAVGLLLACERSVRPGRRRRR